MSRILDVRHPKHAAHSSWLPDDRHVRRVLILAFAFFVSGLVFFGLRMQSSQEALIIPTPIRQEAQPLPEAPRSRLANLPPPSSYRLFQYHIGMSSFDATTTCADRYAVVMLFPSGIDYRADPQSAVINRASPCDGSPTAHTTIPLSSPPLIEGNRYYLVRAQQGNGTWYNPY